MKYLFFLAVILLSSNAYCQDSTYLQKEQELKMITKKGNKVFIEAFDKNVLDSNALIHTANALNSWGYWKLTKIKEEADFILKITFRYAGLGDTFGNAQFINPKNNEILKTTREVNTIMSWDVNTKRGVIKKIIAKEIKPNYKD